MSENNIHPAGQFAATVADHGITKTSNGKEQVAVKFETEHGFITGFFALSEKAIEYTLEKLQACGFDGSSLLELQSDPPRLAGNKCSIKVVHEEYDGKTNAKVQFVNPDGYVGFELKKDTDAAANAAKKYDALLRARIGSKSAQTKLAQGADFPANDGDVPF